MARQHPSSAVKPLPRKTTMIMSSSVGLGVDRAAAVMLVQQSDDAVGDRRE
jgi:hypothetical protein